MLNLYKFLKERDKEKRKKFLDEIEKLKDKKVLLILFGSRAKGKASFLCDYDVLLVGDAELKLDFVDVFKYGNLEEIKREIDKLNSVVLDALIEGIVLVDNLKVADKLRKYALKKVSEKGLKKTRAGWIPERKN